MLRAVRHNSGSLSATSCIDKDKGGREERSK